MSYFAYECELLKKQRFQEKWVVALRDCYSDNIKTTS